MKLDFWDYTEEELKKFLKDMDEFHAKSGVNPKPHKEILARYYCDLYDRQKSDIDLQKWIPSLPKLSFKKGEFGVIVGGTGVGKTYLCQSLCQAIVVPTLFFEMELPASAMAERFLQIQYGTYEEDIAHRALAKERLNIDSFKHVLTDTRAGLDVGEIEDTIMKTKESLEMKIKMVIIDYLGLMKSKLGKSRYESLSNVAEDLKVVAKNTETAILAVSQISRMAARRGGEISLFDAKDSGSIENSSQLVIGIWRDDLDKNVLWVKVLKSTRRGESEFPIGCRFDWNKTKFYEDPSLCWENREQEDKQQPFFKSTDF